MGVVVLMKDGKVLNEGELTGQHKCVICVQPIDAAEYFSNDFAHVACSDNRADGFYEMIRRSKA